MEREKKRERKGNREKHTKIWNGRVALTFWKSMEIGLYMGLVASHFIGDISTRMGVVSSKAGG